MYAAQTNVAPPTFVFFTNVATSFHFSYERFLINKLRESFGMEGTPIRIQVRRREQEQARRDGEALSSYQLTVSLVHGLEAVPPGQNDCKPNRKSS